MQNIVIIIVLIIILFLFLYNKSENLVNISNLVNNAQNNAQNNKFNNVTISNQIKGSSIDISGNINSNNIKSNNITTSSINIENKNNSNNANIMSDQSGNIITNGVNISVLNIGDGVIKSDTNGNLITNNINTNSFSINDVSGNTVFNIDNSGNITAININAINVPNKSEYRYIQICYDKINKNNNKNVSDGKWTIGEIEVYNYYGVNIARDKPVIRVDEDGSSISGINPNNIVDGYPSKYYEINSTDTKHTLQIDLDENNYLHPINRIQIFSRQDGDLQYRTTGTIIKLFKDKPTDENNNLISNINPIVTIDTGRWDNIFSKIIGINYKSTNLIYTN